MELCSWVTDKMIFIDCYKCVPFENLLCTMVYWYFEEMSVCRVIKYMELNTAMLKE